MYNSFDYSIILSCSIVSVYCLLAEFAFCTVRYQDLGPEVWTALAVDRSVVNELLVIRVLIEVDLVMCDVD